jgi:hypothetical protein
MDGVALTLYLLATLVGGLTSGLAGFAMGIVVSGMWLHIISPVQTAILIVGYGLLTQGYAIWKLRDALRWGNVAPFIVTGAIGAPIGAILFAYVDPTYLRTAFSVPLVLYSVYGLAQPAIKPVQFGLPADLAVGLLNGLIGGLTGLTGIVVTIWCQLRGWPKDVQRTVFQPVNLVNIVISLISLSIAGAVTAETIKLYVLGLPLMLGGLWAGFKLYGRLDEAAFRKIVLLLVLISGLALIVPALSHAYGRG